jgi:hypothetical protein
MKIFELRLLVIVVGLVVFSASGLAHHGTNISYDHDKPITLTGTVTEFVWSNPHAQLYFDVKDAGGKVVKWAGELNSPGVLGRAGWTRRTFKAGDEITLTVFPSKAGATVGVVDQSKGVVLNGKPLPRERND